MTLAAPAPAAPAVKKEGASTLIELINVSFAYGRNSAGEPIHALEGVNFKVTSGEFLGVVGPNGGGKSTLLKLVLGLLKPTSGEIKVLGKAPWDLGKERRRLGYVPQDTGIRQRFPATIEDVVLMGTYGGLGLFKRPGKSERALARDLISQVGLVGLEDQPAWKLSGGQMQRVAIARALIAQPEILLLDEPTSGLDTGGQARLFTLLEQIKKDHSLTVIMVSHDVTALAHYAEQIACLSKRLHFHDRSELISEAVLSKVYGCELDALFVQHRSHLAEFHGDAAPAGHAHGPHCNHDHSHSHSHGHSHGDPHLPG
jgi:zinc transport system ATP-binding protein